MTKAKKQLFIFLFLVLFGTLIRLIDFPGIPFSLFSDEVDIGYQAMSFRETGKDYFGNFLPLQFHSFSDIRTSLPIYATILVSYLPGVSLELAVRLTPLLFAIGSLLLIYYFVNALYDHFNLEKGKGLLQPGHFAVFILSVSPWHFTYSRTAFELSQLFFFTLLGLYLFLKYQKTYQIKLLCYSLVVLGLTPMIYSTAKLAVIGYPVILWLMADTKSRRVIVSRWYLGVLMFFPLTLLLLNGGAGRRFGELAIYTDPTIPSQINYIRQTDLGPNLIVGSTPSLTTKIVHNKAETIIFRFINNAIKPLSATYLFLTGDPNPRHALPDWGMFLRSFIIILFLGSFALFNRNHKNLTLALVIFICLAIAPSALTRDGADHSSRLYMLLLPLVIIMTIGWTYLSRYRVVLVLLLLLTLTESFFYFHDYFTHYPYVSEKDFHVGLKEVVQAAKAEDTFAIISPKYEPPLIFFLFYTHFPPAKFQSLLNNKQLYHPLNQDLNLEGYQIGDEPIFIASVRNVNGQPLYPMKGIYYMTFLEATAIYREKMSSLIPAIKSPSGLPLYYRIEAN